MNTRDYKEFAPGEYYHIYNRGTGKMDIFRDEEDYLNFLKRLKIILGVQVETKAIPGNRKKGPWARPLQIIPLPKDSFSLACYSLMPNHFHFLIKQNTELPISKFITKLCTSYAMYFNKKYDRVGTIFQDAFKSINVDSNEYLLWLSAYIHQNPSVAGLVWDLKEWKWSSYSSFLGGNKDDFCDKEIILGQFEKDRNPYRRFVETSYDAIKDKKLVSNIFID